MAAFQRLAVRDLLIAYLSFPEAIRKAQDTTAFALALMVIRHYLRDEWILAHLDASSRSDGFMRLDLREPIVGYMQRFKVIDLAECLFNLQDSPGFEECITQIRQEPLIEATLAELHVGRMLHVKDYRFRFMKRTFIKGKDYDLEIDVDKWIVCADVKCKLEHTQISAGTITDALRTGSRQLPGNKPGMLFVTVPQNWTLKYL